MCSTTNASWLLEKRYGDPLRLYASYRKEIKNWPPVNYGNAKSCRDFFAFLNKYNSLGAATKWNAMETPYTLCMLVSKLPVGTADRWKRKALMLWKNQQREPSLKDFIEFCDEETVLVNNPILLREAITAYVGNQEKSDNQRKRRKQASLYYFRRIYTMSFPLHLFCCHDLLKKILHMHRWKIFFPTESNDNNWRDSKK